MITMVTASSRPHTDVRIAAGEEESERQSFLELMDAGRSTSCRST